MTTAVSLEHVFPTVVLAASHDAANDISISEAMRAGMVNILEQLHVMRDLHPFWANPLLQACEARLLTGEELAFVLTQEAACTRMLTRQLAAPIARCDNDQLHAELARDLWQAVGAAGPTNRLASPWQGLLRDGLCARVDDNTGLDPATEVYTRDCLDCAFHGDPVHAAAFLALGSLGVVPRMVDVFAAALRGAAIRPQHLELFRVLAESARAQAVTLERLLLALSASVLWKDLCRLGMEHALGLKQRCCERLHATIMARRARREVAR